MPKAAPVVLLPADEVERFSEWNCKEEGSDKDYIIHLVAAQDGTGWIVNVAYGRSGREMKTGCKTGASPVSYDKAFDRYEKEVQIRLGKRYKLKEKQPGERANAGYVHPLQDKVHSGISPQLLNVMTQAELDFLLDCDTWGAQEKHFGERRMIRRTAPGEAVEGINRKGFVVGYSKDIKEALVIRPQRFVLDGEAMGQALYAFDLLEDGERDLRSLPYEERHRLLCVFAEGLGSAIIVVPLARTATEKHELLARLVADHAEGIVMKRLSAPAVAGRPNSGGNQLKFKLYETATFIVKSINDKRSVELMLLDGDTEVGVGNVTIPPNKPIPELGELVEVRYLHAYKGGSIYEPSYLGVRDDVDRSECKLSQLKWKV